MDTRSLDFMLRDAERQSFERDGYFIVENALTPAQVELALAATDRLADEARAKNNLGRATASPSTILRGVTKPFSSWWTCRRPSRASGGCWAGTSSSITRT